MPRPTRSAATTTATSPGARTSSAAVYDDDDDDDDDNGDHDNNNNNHGGNGEDVVMEEESEADRPVKALVDKWSLIPEFIKCRGLLRQHIDSFDQFLEEDMKRIVLAPGNNRINMDAEHYLEYLDVSVGLPSESTEAERNVKVKTRGDTPQECRLRDLTYAAPIRARIRYRHKDNTGEEKWQVIGFMPIMLKSKKCALHGLEEAALIAHQECPHDPGGYFVIKGVEKVILIQEQLSKNRVIVDRDPAGLFQANVTSSTAEKKTRTSVLLKNDRILLRHNVFVADLPIGIVFKAMGVETDQAIAAHVGCSEHARAVLSSSLTDSSHVQTQLQALEWIGDKIKGRAAWGVGGGDVNAAAYQTFLQKKAQGLPQHGGDGDGGGEDDDVPLASKGRADEVANILATTVIAHVPAPGFAFRDKAAYLGYMVRSLLDCAAAPSLVDDKDNTGNKRLELAGNLLELLFEDLFKRFNAELKRQCDMVLRKKHAASALDVTAHIRTNTITDGLVHALATGNWTVRRFKMDRQGITQQLSRLSYIGALGHMTRVMSQFEKTRKVSGPRALQSSQWGVLCPTDTPEGESCGLVKNLTLLAHVTRDQPPEAIVALLRELQVAPTEQVVAEDLLGVHGCCTVLVNGVLVGAHRDPHALARRLRALRRAGQLGEFVSVYVDEARRRLAVSCDGGRACRPLIVVEGGKVRVTQEHLGALKDRKHAMSFASFIAQGLVEFVDVMESNNLRIALREDDVTATTTHLEIDPSSVLGVVAGLIPFPHHNQSPRNTYQCAMGKQAIGTVALNQALRFDTLLYVMTYPQRPLVTTRTLDAIKFDQLPGGQNAVVAVMSHAGYDIEDAVVLNKASLDRGYGRCAVLRRWGCQLKTPVGVKNLPDRVAPFPAARTDLVPAFAPRGDPGGAVLDRALPLDERKTAALEADGVAGVGLVLHPQGVYVQKLSAKDESETYVDTAAVYKGAHPVVVERVIAFHTDQPTDPPSFKVLTRDTRRPELGDKFSSRHGQKGVCGLVVAQEDMPFDDEGVVPDMIMNPHGFPSRMTVGKTIELLSGKASVFDGHIKDGSAFADALLQDPISHLCEVLVRHGHSYAGTDVLYSGTTGEPLPAYVFIGPVFYQKLKHMVVDKIHARATGPRAVLTRQPTEGRSKDGGLRLGEMERDCLIAYGSAGMLIERLMISSDAYDAVVCEECGLLCSADACHRCGGDNLANVRVPYAFKLLLEELMCMNVVARIVVEPSA